MSGHDIALLIHLLLFVYWLGGDIGVFYSSGLSVNRSLSREARQMAGKIMINLDLIPRLCLSLMLTVGGILTCLLYTSPSPRDVEESRMPSSA